MRNGTYPLEKELGRYRGLKAENRTFQLCKIEAETEEHFLICVGPARKPHCWFSHEAVNLLSNSDNSRFNISR